jgi:lycopene cyclase domain-containing protein
MASEYTYLWVDLGCIAVPFIASFHPKLQFNRKFFPHLVLALAGTMLLFIPWDILFTHWKVWAFNEKYTLGISGVNLPIEEWLFFICIPFACVFTYECMKYFFPNLNSKPGGRSLAIAVSAIFLIIAFLHTDHAYTFSAHFLCALLLIFHAVRNTPWLLTFFVMYLMIFPAFIISNGILTGLDFWQYNFILTDPGLVTDQIVWYDNNENLGIRIFSVPMDDISYGMLMLLLNVTIYEYSLGRKKRILSTP